MQRVWLYLGEERMEDYYLGSPDRIDLGVAENEKETAMR
jgi:hypothetical protein